MSTVETVLGKPNVEIVESRFPHRPVEVKIIISDVEWICSASRSRRVSNIMIHYWSEKRFLEFHSLERWVRKVAATGSWLAEELSQYISKALESVLGTRVHVEIETEESKKLLVIARV